MATIVKYENMRLSCVENGWVLSYDEVRTTGGGTPTWNYCNQKIYKDGEEMAALTDMKAMRLNEYNGEDNSPVKEG